MNPDQIKQIVETIKTLNININDATTQKLVDTIIPVVNKFIWLRVFEDLLIAFSVVGTILFIAILFYKYVKAEIDRN